MLHYTILTGTCKVCCAFCVCACARVCVSVCARACVSEMNELPLELQVLYTCQPKITWLVHYARNENIRASPS